MHFAITTSEYAITIESEVCKTCNERPLTKVKTLPYFRDSDGQLGLRNVHKRSLGPCGYLWSLGDVLAQATLSFEGIRQGGALGATPFWFLSCKTCFACRLHQRLSLSSSLRSVKPNWIQSDDANEIFHPLFALFQSHYRPRLIHNNMFDKKKGKRKNAPLKNQTYEVLLEKQDAKMQGLRPRKSPRSFNRMFLSIFWS